MPKSSFKKLLIIILILIAAFYLGKSITTEQKSDPVKQAKDTNKKVISNSKIKINEHTFNIEIADDEKIRGKGLSYRDSLPDDSGMLFVFNKPAFYSFWMKDMKFPLDFIWIKDDTIVDISENIPVPTTSILEELPTYTPKSAVDKVLELNSGKVNEIKAKIGDKIKLVK